MGKKKQGSPTRAERRVLFAMGEREINATSSRLLRCPLTLAEQGYQVDVMTHDPAIKEQLDEYYAGKQGVTTRLLQQEDRFWTMRERDGFAETFIKLYQDLPLPGGDMPFWKMVAFDDFLWHVSRTVQAPIEGDYCAVFMPVPSAFERPRDAADVFYTNTVYYCKQNGVPLVGMQIYPITDVPAIYVDIPDYWLVDEAAKARYFTDHGVAAERVFVIDGLKDGYCISTVDDHFRSLLVKDQLQVPKDSLAVAIVNHSSNRMQLREIIETVGRVRHKKTVFFVFVGIAVRELTEKSVFDDLILPALQQHADQYYAVDNGGVMRALMLSDVIVSTSYILPLSFAPKYGKTSVVYNPLRDPSPYVEGVSFVDKPAELERVFDAAWTRKQAEVRLADVMKRIVP